MKQVPELPITREEDTGTRCPYRQSPLASMPKRASRVRSGGLHLQVEAFKIQTELNTEYGWLALLQAQAPRKPFDKHRRT